MAGAIGPLLGLVGGGLIAGAGEKHRQEMAEQAAARQSMQQMFLQHLEQHPEMVDNPDFQKSAKKAFGAGWDTMVPTFKVMAAERAQRTQATANMLRGMGPQGVLMANMLEQQAKNPMGGMPNMGSSPATAAAPTFRLPPAQRATQEEPPKALAQARPAAASVPSAPDSTTIASPPSASASDMMTAMGPEALDWAEAESSGDTKTANAIWEKAKQQLEKQQTEQRQSEQFQQRETREGTQFRETQQRLNEQFDINKKIQLMGIEGNQELRRATLALATSNAAATRADREQAEKDRVQAEQDRKQLSQASQDLTKERDADRKAEAVANLGKTLDTQRDKILADFDKTPSTGAKARVDSYNSGARMFYRRHASAGAPTILKYSETPSKIPLMGPTPHVETIPPTYGTNKKTGQSGWRDADGNFYPDANTP